MSDKAIASNSNWQNIATVVAVVGACATFFANASDFRSDILAATKKNDDQDKQIVEVKKSVDGVEAQYSAMQVVVAQLAATSTANQQSMKEDIKYIIERLDEQAKDR